MKKRNQAKLGDLVESLLQKAGLKERAKQYRVMLDWNDIVGAANARHSRPVAIRDGILLVECSSAAWAQTLTLLREQITQKIAQQMGECPLREIHFRGVSLHRSQLDEEEQTKESPPAEVVLSTEQVEWIRRTVTEINDVKLRQKAEEALGSLLRQRKWHESRGGRICPSCDRLHTAKTERCRACLEKQAPKSK